MNTNHNIDKKEWLNALQEDQKRYLQRQYGCNDLEALEKDTAFNTNLKTLEALKQEFRLEDEDQQKNLELLSLDNPERIKQDGMEKVYLGFYIFKAFTEQTGNPNADLENAHKVIASLPKPDFNITVFETFKTKLKDVRKLDINARWNILKGDFEEKTKSKPKPSVWTMLLSWPKKAYTNLKHVVKGLYKGLTQRDIKASKPKPKGSDEMRTGTFFRDVKLPTAGLLKKKPIPKPKKSPKIRRIR